MKLTPIQIIGIIIVVNGALIGSTAQLTDLLGALIAKDIVSIASIGNSIFGGVIMMLSGQGSMVKSVLAMPGVERIAVNGQASSALATLAMDPDQNKIAPTSAAVEKVTATAKAAASVLFAFIIVGLMFAQPAMAAPKAAPKLAKICDPLNLIPGCKPAAAASTAAPSDIIQKIMDDIAAKSTTIITNVVSAINEADADASVLTNSSDPTSFRDAISHACYPAQVKFLQSLPQVQAIQSPAPYNVIVLFQRKRDLIAQIKAGLPTYLKIGCAALLKDEETILLQTLGLIGVQVAAGSLAGIFPPAAPLALPALAL